MSTHFGFYSKMKHMEKQSSSVITFTYIIFSSPSHLVLPSHSATYSTVIYTTSRHVSCLDGQNNLFCYMTIVSMYYGVMKTFYLLPHLAQYQGIDHNLWTKGDIDSVFFSPSGWQNCKSFIHSVYFYLQLNLVKKRIYLSKLIFSGF